MWYAVSPQGSVLWTLGLPFTGQSIPAIGADGTLYVGSKGLRTHTGGLIAVDPGGTVRWVLTDSAGILSSPALGPDGTIYTAGGRHLYAVDPSGEVRCTYESANPAEPIRMGPALGPDGTIYMAGGRRVYAVDPEGESQWTYDADAAETVFLTSSPCRCRASTR